MRRIKSIKVENFKSLVNFEIELSKFSCLIGLNGSGKSTVLQFIDFLPQLICYEDEDGLRGGMKGWLEERGWKATDLRSKLSGEMDIKFHVRFVDGQGEPAGDWWATYSPSANRCTSERFAFLNCSLESRQDKVAIADKDTIRINTKLTQAYKGSILSSIKEELLPAPILEFKKLFGKFNSLELLAPDRLRQRTRESSGTLGLGGQNLSSFLYEMSDQKRTELRNKLTEAYPQLQDLSSKPLRSGWKQIEINESYDGQEISESDEPRQIMLFPEMITEAHHINDGMLRLIAILAELQSEHSFSIFDEIENGINPELIEFVLDELVTTPKQVLVTTHSPMILNYLDDDVATKGVIYLYKTRQGHTRSIPFFTIPSLAEKLKVMGPGEAFVDTNLKILGEEIEAFTEGQ